MSFSKKQILFLSLYTDCTVLGAKGTCYSKRHHFYTQNRDSSFLENSKLIKSLYDMQDFFQIIGHKKNYFKEKHEKLLNNNSRFSITCCIIHNKNRMNHIENVKLKLCKQLNSFSGKNNKK